MGRGDKRRRKRKRKAKTKAQEQAKIGAALEGVLERVQAEHEDGQREAREMPVLPEPSESILSDFEAGPHPTGVGDEKTAQNRSSRASGGETDPSEPPFSNVSAGNPFPVPEQPISRGQAERSSGASERAELEGPELEGSELEGAADVLEGSGDELETLAELELELDNFAGEFVGFAAELKAEIDALETVEEISDELEMFTGSEDAPNDAPDQDARPDLSSLSEAELAALDIDEILSMSTGGMPADGTKLDDVFGVKVPEIIVKKGPGVTTVIIEASAGEVMRHASKYLQTPAVKQVGRLTALQSPTLDNRTEFDIRTMAAAFQIPVRKILFDQPRIENQKALAGR